MSTELINRITIKKDGVYISTHSSNDTSPFYSTKNDLLTDTYNKEGQEGLDKAIIDLCFYNCELRGSHISIVTYKKAIEKAIYDKDFIGIRNEYDELSDKAFDIANGFNEYKELSKEQLVQLYDEIKSKVEEARNKRNEFVVNIVKEMREEKTKTSELVTNITKEVNEAKGLNQTKHKEMPEVATKGITLNFSDILSEMKNKDIKFIFGIGNTLCIEDNKNNLYEIETYYHGSYLDKMITNGYTVTFNLIGRKEAEHLNDLYENEKEVFNYNNMKDFLANHKLENTQQTERDDIDKEEDELEI